MQHSDTAAMEH